MTKRLAWRWALALGIVLLVTVIVLGRPRPVPIEQRAAALDAIVADAVDGKNVHGAVVRIVARGDTLSFAGKAGVLEQSTPYFIASTTKLYVTALIMQLRHEGLLSLDDRLADLLPAEEWKGLNRLDGIDRSDAITVRQLLAHTSGIPDYFEGERANGRRLDKELLAGKDRGWTTAQALDMAREMKPPFPPGKPGKARYSDTNFQLLGRIIEVKTKQSFDDALTTRILAPLGLTSTYMYRDTSDKRPADIIGSDGALRIPRAMASFGPDGGVVSTAEEQLTFLRAFFEGRLFPEVWLKEMRQWNPVFFPLEAGVGMLRFQLPRWMPPFTKQPELIGHSGLSGAFAFYSPDKDVYVTGTVNTVASQSAPFELMLRLLAVLPDAKSEKSQ
ncbi:MAG: beta-lactamase family protein [Gemmatimonadaceae bacterium]|nr:beta-lactamase family protein [Gemmatimonadaceae bacterium]